jgi:hypothetical protein
MTILDAVHDPHLFRPLFKDLTTWQAWLVWLKSLFALPMNEQEVELFRRCTQREHPPEHEVNEAFTICGRRSGKSFLQALVVVYLGCFRSYREYLSPGERAVILVLARDRRQANVLYSYVAGILRAVPMLEALIEREVGRIGEQELQLTNGVTILVGVSDYRAVRGLTLAAAVLDELSFWRSEISVTPDKAVVDALRPALATIPSAKLLAISSPYGRTGIMYESYQAFYGRDDAEALVWKADSRTMNPTLSEGLIERELQRDPEAARAEWLGEFREDLETYVSRTLLRELAISDRTDLPPSWSIQYRAFADPAGGSGRDSFTLAVGHKQADGKLVIDAVRERRPPFAPSEVVEEYAALLKTYQVREVTGDRYASEWPVEQFRKHGITYRVADRSKSDLYRDCLPLLTSRQVELPDHKKLLSQFASLERRTTRGSGRETIDHPSGHGFHDDVSNAVAGCLVTVWEWSRYKSAIIKLRGA